MTLKSLEAGLDLSLFVSVAPLLKVRLLCKTVKTYMSSRQ